MATMAFRPSMVGFCSSGCIQSMMPGSFSLEQRFLELLPLSTLALSVRRSRLKTHEHWKLLNACRKRLPWCLDRSISIRPGPFEPPETRIITGRSGVTKRLNSPRKDDSVVEVIQMEVDF
jgi:hypothetical protein